MLKQKLKMFQIYIVTWFDHFSEDESWKPDSELENINDEKIEEAISRVLTVGFLVKNTKKWIVLASNRGDGDSSVYMHILKSCIVDIKEIDTP